MKAAVSRAIGADFILEDLSLAPPGPEDVQVRIAAAAICHSDISYVDGIWDVPPPFVVGHEAAGVVQIAGAKTPYKPGDRVLVTLLRSCGTCPCCTSGLESSCDRRFDARESPLRDASGAPVVQAMNCGAFAEAVTVHATQVHILPDAIPLDSASLLACGVITGAGAVTNTAKVQPGQSVTVIGAGGVGLNTIQAAAIAGAFPIIAIDISDEKLATAKAFGATHGILIGKDAARSVKSLTDGRGCDYVFVIVGAPKAFETAPDMLAGGGAMVIVGMTGSKDCVPYKPVILAASNLRFLGSSMGQTVLTRDIPRLLGQYDAGRLKLDELVAARFPFAEINAAFAHTRKGVAGRTVVIVDPSLV